MENPGFIPDGKLESACNGKTPPELGGKCDEGKEASWSRLRQIVCALSISTGQFVVAFLIASTSFLPKMLNENSPDQVYTAEDVKWIASVPILATIFGNLGCFMMIRRLGPAAILQICYLVALALYGLMVAFPRSEVVFASRFGAFVVVGLFDVIGVPLVIELSEPKMRGFCGVFPELLTSFGILYTFVTLSFLSGSMAMLANSVPLILGFVGSFFVPESPYWLVERGEDLKAEKSFARVMGNSQPKIKERLFQTVECYKNNTKGQNTSRLNKIKRLGNSKNWKPLVITIVIFGLSQFCGTLFILYSALTVFEEADVHVDAFMCTVIIGVVRVVSSLFSCVVQYKVGRRKVLFTTLLVSGICLIGAGLILHYDVVLLKIVPLVAIIIFLLANGCGIGVIPFVLIGELLPPEVKFLSTGIVFSFFSFYQFIIVIMTPSFLKAFSVAIALISFGVINIINIVIIHFILPETKHKTLTELDQLFK